MDSARSLSAVERPLSAGCRSLILSRSVCAASSCWQKPLSSWHGDAEKMAPAVFRRRFAIERPLSAPASRRPLASATHSPLRQVRVVRDATGQLGPRRQWPHAVAVEHGRREAEELAVADELGEATVWRRQVSYSRRRVELVAVDAAAEARRQRARLPSSSATSRARLSVAGVKWAGGGRSTFAATVARCRSWSPVCSCAQRDVLVCAVQ